jgi:hypothetical protein
MLNFDFCLRFVNILPETASMCDLYNSLEFITHSHDVVEVSVVCQIFERDFAWFLSRLLITSLLCCSFPLYFLGGHQDLRKCIKTLK